MRVIKWNINSREEKISSSISFLEVVRDLFGC